jgi:PadR family transcriptional regulator, regulatory protein AphA
MSLEHAILGFLQYKALSGYDLKAEFDFSLQSAWPADQSQIYRTLARLAEKKWIDTEVVRQSSRPDRKVYHITKQGREELLQWLRMPAVERDVRLAQLIQIFFAAHLSDDQILNLFEGFAELIRLNLAEMQEFPKKVILHRRNIHTAPRDEFFRLITLEYLVRMDQAYLALLEDVIARLKRGDHHLEANENEEDGDRHKTRQRAGIKKTGKKESSSMKPRR